MKTDSYFTELDKSFHSAIRVSDLVKTTPITSEMKFTYTFNNHFHPFVGELLEQLNKQSIEGLLDPKFHEKPELNLDFFEEFYKPNEKDDTVAFGDFPKKEIDVSKNGAYAVYNWELLFHVPFSIAVHLSKNQRFAEAQRWFHYIFDPTADDGQFWRFLAFREEKDPLQVDELLRLLSKPEDSLSETEQGLKYDLLSSYESLRENPFQPHRVARTRFLAYQYNVVMKYLDNLIDWGDSLFRQDSIETLNEATQIYILAANLLGPKPKHIPQRGTVKPKTFAQIRKKMKDKDKLGNFLVELEGEFPFNFSFPKTEGIDTDTTSPLFGIGHTLYFCIPHNEKLLGYWDKAADRLFKIRHCMNIEGVVRQLPLFQPPIDPGMLVKAAAAGIDISSMVSGLNQPLAPVRSVLLIQKALEICSEVRGLGGALLSALEKQDGEKLGLLRQKHEINIQQLAQDVRYLQWKEAQSNTESLLKTRESAVERYSFYQRLLDGSEENLKKITEFTLERQDLSEENFDDVYGELVEQYDRKIEPEEFPDLEVQDNGKLYLNNSEDAEINLHMPTARDLGLSASITKASASAAAFIPSTIKVDTHFWGLGATTEFPLGTGISKGINIAAEVQSLISAYNQAQASLASRTASYERRADDWMLQSNLAARELMQIGRQIISSLIREQIARHEYENIKTQIEQSKEIDQFLHDKFTNKELYGWMQGELSKLYYEYYKFAFDIARKAEQTMKHELMRPELDDLNYIKFNYWDGGRKGLLSGEALHLDLKRMEMAYHDHNKREYELTRHISLRQLDPLALLNLKTAGACEVTLPEWLFDLDAPGHYMRRIKNISLSIPAVTGPYTSINCTLSLLKSTLRTSSLLRDDVYHRTTDEEDARFVDYYGTIQSIVTSNAQDDAGMFENNLRDERFLPFEGHGAVSTWKLELPAEFKQFDYDTISDVIIHMRYTARQGGALLKQEAEDYLNELLEEEKSSGLIQMFSLKHDFPTEWHQFLNSAKKIKVTIKKEHFPYLVQYKTLNINTIELKSISDLNKTTSLPKDDLVDINKKIENNTKKAELSFDADDVLKPEEDANVFLLIGYTLK